MSERDDVRSQLVSTVRRINQTCVRDRGFDGLAGLFHEDVVMVHPHFSARAAGRDLCLKTYQDACSQMKFHKLDAYDQHVDVFGDAAVVSHRYDCIWEFQGKKFEDMGHEVLVFVRVDKDWQVAWRTLIPGSRQVEKCPLEEGTVGVQVSDDIRQTCLDLITSTVTCQLTTIDSAGFPHTGAMNNLRYAKEYPSLVSLYERQDNDFVLYMSTSMQSPKMARMQANPKVSVFFVDADQFLGLMLGGEIEIITDQDLKNRIWQDGWTMQYPNGPQDPEYGVIKLAPRVAKGWCRNRPFEIQITGQSWNGE